LAGRGVAGRARGAGQSRPLRPAQVRKASARRDEK